MEASFMRVLQKQWGIVLLLSVLLLILGMQQCMAENGQISGLVWLEKNVDGVIGSGETGVAGAKITLEKRDESGKAQVAVNDTSSKAGDFVFSSLAEGEYRLRVETDASYRFTYHGGDSVMLPAQGNVSYSPWITLQSGEKKVLNVGVTKSNCSVSLIAFEDSNANGGRMQSEPVVRGVQVEIIYDYQGETYSVATAMTDRQGEAAIRQLSPAVYRVRVALPEHYAVGPLGQKINSFYNCILPSGDDGSMGVSDYFTLEAKDSVSMGIGMVRTGELTGKAWFDENYNGKWDQDEPGLTEAAITLYSPSMGFSRSTQADSRGIYAFQGLQPGEYQLEFTLPEGMIFTYPGVSLLSSTSSTASMSVNVQVDVTTDLGAVGAMPAAGLTLSLYADENQNGVWDEGEAPLPGAEVAALQDGKKVENAVTDENGAAVLNALRGGETELEVSLPEGWLFSPSADALFAVSGAQSAAHAAVTLDGTQPSALHEAAVIPAASISGKLFESADNSGLFQENSALLSGYTVQAVDALGAVAAQAVTDERGAYFLYPLLPGDYTVQFLLDEAYVASPFGQDNHIQSQTPEYGETEVLSLAVGQQITQVNGGVFRAGVIDGYVLIDESYAADGAGIPNVMVMLLREDGEDVPDYSYGMTDETGYYFVKGVLPGEYSLAYRLPDNGLLTDPASGRTYRGEAFTIESGSQVHMPALYGIVTSTLSGMILHDDTDTAFSALLTLTGIDVGKVVEIRTQPDGSFAFPNLMPGTYSLSVTLPDGLIFGRLEGSLFEASMHGQAAVEIALAMGESIADLNILAVQPVSLSGVMYYDDNLSGVQDEEEYGAEGRALALCKDGEEIDSVFTNDSGSFYFGNLLPDIYELRVTLDENEELVDMPDAVHDGTEWTLDIDLTQDTPLVLPVMRYASVSGQVWSMDGTANGVDGIDVSLLDSQGQTLQTVQTDAQGDFTFGGLNPGEYKLSVDLPEGYLFARAQDTKNRESYIQSQTDGSLLSLSFGVPMGDDLSGIDVGIGTMGGIGDRAWLDENGNGMQDTDEPGMPGIVIEVYQYGELIASTTTDEYGRYSLTNLYPGEYEMRVTMHKELKATLHQTDFPLVASVLPESDELTVSVSGITVPSGKSNLHCDVGFQLRKKGVYPEAMDLIPAKDWRPYSER